MNRNGYPPAAFPIPNELHARLHTSVRKLVSLTNSHVLAVIPGHDSSPTAKTCAHIHTRINYTSESNFKSTLLCPLLCAA